MTGIFTVKAIHFGDEETGRYHEANVRFIPPPKHDTLGDWQHGVSISKEAKPIERDVEQPWEIWEMLEDWWFKAKAGDKFEIKCELEV